MIVLPKINEALLCKNALTFTVVPPADGRLIVTESMFIDKGVELLVYRVSGCVTINAYGITWNNTYKNVCIDAGLYLFKKDMDVLNKVSIEYQDRYIRFLSYKRKDNKSNYGFLFKRPNNVKVNNEES